jgi:hypothetical protein
MPIHIPLLGPIEWLPQLDRDKIPIAEHPALQHIVGLLTALAVQERNFRTAVLLFEASHQENSELANAVSSGVLDFGTLDRATDTLSGWQSIAARDGAMTIYHFGCTVEAIKASLPRCPTLNAGVDHSNLRMARKLFESHFPGYKDIRHVVAHTAEFAATIDDKEIHSHKGRLKISNDSGSVSMEVSDQPNFWVISATTPTSSHLKEGFINTKSVTQRLRNWCRSRNGSFHQSGKILSKSPPDKALLFAHPF